MRIRTVIGIAVPGEAAAVAAGIGGTALAAGPQQAEPAVPVFVSSSPAVSADGSDAGAAQGWVCSEKDGFGAAPSALAGAAEEAL
jgi:hypothetical protein